MPIQEASAICPLHGPVLGRREAPNHVLHFLITFFTCGLWGIVWLLTSLSRGDYACPTCGSKVAPR